MSEQPAQQPESESTPKGQGTAPDGAGPSPLGDQQRVAETGGKDEGGETWYEEFLEVTSKYGNAITAIATALIAVFTFFLICVARSQSKLSRLAIEGAQASERAFVFVRELKTNLVQANSGQPIGYQIVADWGNSGSTPVKSLTININSIELVGDLPEDFEYTYEDPAVPLFLGPKRNEGSHTANIPYACIENVANGMNNLFIWGRADYRDIFPGTRPHFTEFCYQVLARRMPPDGRMSVAFLMAGSHNRTDYDEEEN